MNIPQHATYASPAHRNALLVFLPLFALACAGGMWVVAQLPGHSMDELAVLGLGVLGALISFFMLWARSEMVGRICLGTVLLILALILHRMISLLYGPMATDPAYSLFRPIYAFLPLAWISCFVLLQARHALVTSVVFWVALLVTLFARVAPEWSYFAEREGFYGLLLLVVLGSPMCFVLLALLPRVQRQFADSSSLAVEREVKLASQIDDARQRLEVALVGSSDALFEWNLKRGGGLWLSPRFYELIGRSPDDFKPSAENLRELVHPEDLHRVEELKVGPSGEAGLEVRLLTRTKGYRYFSVRVVRISSGRKGDHLAGSVRDVHARRMEGERIETALSDANEFAKRAAHNLNAPIRRMRLFAERSLRALQGAEPDKGAIAKNLRKIVENSSQSDEFVDALLDYAAALVPHEAAEVELNQVFSDLVVDFEDRIQRSNAVVDVADLPTVVGDAGDLKQLFSELMENALLYSPKTPAIRVDAQRFSDSAVISVHDRGIGIAPEHLYSIFEPLMRLHSREEYVGNGLGLAIARMLSAKYHGQIWVESEPGQGSVFRVRLLTPGDD